MSEKEPPTWDFVGPPLTAADLCEVIKTVQEHGIVAGIIKHFELADKHESEDERNNPPKL
jgi:hypothetical protein